ncbi:hypothetical protein Tco_1034726, partial [Tanacetum coccineum]
AEAEGVQACFRSKREGRLQPINHGRVEKEAAAVGRFRKIARTLLKRKESSSKKNEKERKKERKEERKKVRCREKEKESQ